jgi:hypothetical protein
VASTFDRIRCRARKSVPINRDSIRVQLRAINSPKRYLHVGSGVHSRAVVTGAKWYSHFVPTGDIRPVVRTAGTETTPPPISGDLTQSGIPVSRRGACRGSVFAAHVGCGRGSTFAIYLMRRGPSATSDITAAMMLRIAATMKAAIQLLPVAS